VVFTDTPDVLQDKVDYRFNWQDNAQKNNGQVETFRLQKIVVTDFAEEQHTHKKEKDMQNDTLQVNGVGHISGNVIKPCAATEQNPEQTQEQDGQHVLLHRLGIVLDFKVSPVISHENRSYQNHIE